jgi:hypothetical protein
VRESFLGVRRYPAPLLVPTLRVGTHVRPLCGPILSDRWGLAATRSVANLRSHAERGNESYHQNPRRHSDTILAGKLFEIAPARIYFHSLGSKSRPLRKT